MDPFEEYEARFRKLDELGNELQIHLTELMDSHQKALEFFENMSSYSEYDKQRLADALQSSEETMERYGPYAARLHEGQRNSEENRRKGNS